MPVFEITSPEGAKYQITGPEGATEEQALTQLQSQLGQQAKPSVVGDVAKQALSGLAEVPEMTASFIPSMLNVAGKAAEKVLPSWLSNPEANAKREEFAKSLEGQRFSISDYLPKPGTTAGEYARTVTPFVAGAAGLRGSLTKNAIGGTVAGAGSETAGQLTKGTEAEPYARMGGALLGGIAGARGIEATANRLARTTVPAGAEAKQAAQAGYKAVTEEHVATPIPQSELDAVAHDIRTTLNKGGLRPSVADAAHKAVNEIETPATKGAADVADLAASRQNMKQLLGAVGPDKAAATIALPKIEAAIERLSPDTMAKLREADRNWAGFKGSETLDKKVTRAELRASGEGSGLNLGNKLRQKAADLLLSNDARFYSPEVTTALKQMVKGTVTQNALRLVGNALGGGGGLGLTAVASLGAGAAGHYSGHPELAALPFLGVGLRMGGNRLIANQAKNVGALIRSETPLAQQNLPSILPSPTRRLSQREAGLLSALYAKPAARGLLALSDRQ